MTLTDRTMEWLDQNRHRSYPIKRDEWRKKASPESGLDCIILDVIAFDPDSSSEEPIAVSNIHIGRDETVICMSYCGNAFSITLTGGGLSGMMSFDRRRKVLDCGRIRPVTMSIVFSSHAYIHDVVGEGEWDIGCNVLDSRVVRMTHGVGVDGISYNGSHGVAGRESSGVSSGDVVLEDGYRTSPIIHRGKVLVRVGRNYGYDPCEYDYGDDGAVDCRDPMFFFCGQNAVNSGNVILKGGSGINIVQGGKYHVKSGTCEGKEVPCIEIVAGKELLDMYRPS